MNVAFLHFRIENMAYKSLSDKIKPQSTSRRPKLLSHEHVPDLSDRYFWWFSNFSRELFVTLEANSCLLKISRKHFDIPGILVQDTVSVSLHHTFGNVFRVIFLYFLAFAVNFRFAWSFTLSISTVLFIEVVLASVYMRWLLYVGGLIFLFKIFR